ncbi:hypothetical protein CKO15_09915 [Halorhodospira abdelmalekii]|nr:hypothetical protein [Halorhodospira abdelmalekii]
MASALFEAGIGDHHSNPGECTLDNADDFGWKYMLDPSGRDVLRQDGPGPYLGVFQRTRSAIINCYGCENGDFSNISDSIDDHGVIRGNSTTVSFHEEEHMLPSVTGDPADIQTAINHAENVGDQNFSRVLNVPAHYHRLGGDIGDLQTYFVEQYELERRLTNGNAEAWATLEGEQVVTFEDNRFEACNMDARVNTIEPLLVKLKAPQAVTEHAQRIPIGPGKIQYDTPHGTFFVRYDANAAKELLDAGGNPINFPSVEEPTDWLEEECGDLFDPTIPIP